MNFDFNKKDVAVDENAPMLQKKKAVTATSRIPRIINIKLGFDRMPKGFWAILIAAATLLAMHNKVEEAGWGLLLAFFMLDKREGLIPFLLVCLGLAGMYSHIEGAGWLLFFAFIF